jgi:MFS family permease
MPLIRPPAVRPALRRSLSRWQHDMDAFTAGPPYDGDGKPLDGRERRRLSWVEGAVSSISESFVTSFANPYALSLGATNSQIGLLSSLSSLCAAIGLLPGARLGEQVRSRKRLLILANGGAARLVLFLMALAPLVLPANQAVLIFIVLFAARSFISMLGFPAWSSMLADMVPLPIRGRYLSARNMGIAAAALVVTPLAGAMIQRIGQPTGYQVSFLIAGVIGLLATALFARIHEPLRAVAHKDELEIDGSVIRQLRARPRFMAFAVVSCLLNFAVTIAGPYFTVYMVRDLGATPFQIGVFATVEAATSIIGLRMWGRLNDRHGPAWVIRITGFLLPLMPLVWLVIPGPWFVIIINVMSGLIWSGNGLAGFNLLLNLAPTHHRERYLAFNQLGVYAGAAAGPLLGSLLVGVVAIKGLFVISTVGRLLVALLFLLTVRGDYEIGQPEASAALA